MLTVCINFNSLPSWLMLDPLQAMLEQTSVVVDWQPLLGAPINLVETGRDANKNRSDDPLAAYKARRALARARFATREHERNCDRLGIGYEAGRRSIDPLCLSLGLLWLKTANQQTCFDYCRSAFHQLFVAREINLETSNGVAELLNKLDVTTAGFETFSSNETRSLEANQSRLLESGVLHAPAFIVNGEVFLGREHLPLITWMLQGRQA